MLAAECVCALLTAEHAMIRHTLATLDDALNGQAWHEPGPALQRLRAWMEYAESFDRSYHRPKEYDHLLPALSGKTAALDRLMCSLDQAHTRGDERLEQAFALLRELEHGHVARAPDLVLLLRRYRLTVLQRLQTEEAVLLPLARELLAQEEWSRIASEISSGKHDYDDADGEPMSAQGINTAAPRMRPERKSSSASLARSSG